MKDYSQDHEQAAILAALDRPRSIDGDWSGIGRFLDIGAYHPTVFSNTRALWEAGWSGVMIEPSPGPMLALLAEYGNDERITLINAAVTLTGGPMPLHVSNDAVSTSSDAEFEKWKTAGGFIGKMICQSIRLEDIANQYGGFDLWSIDAEGQSADLFLRALELGYYPRCFVVEHDNRLVELMGNATKKGYVATFSNAANVVFVQK